MKTTELMIGDYVRRTDIATHTPCRVEAVSDDSIYMSFIDRFGNKCYGNLFENEIEPYALEDNPKFWKKQGFERQADGSYSMIDDYFSINIKEYSDSIWQLVVEHSELFNETDQCTVCNLHQLQQALRLFGIGGAWNVSELEFNVGRQQNKQP